MGAITEFLKEAEGIGCNDVYIHSIEINGVAGVEVAVVLDDCEYESFQVSTGLVPKLINLVKKISEEFSFDVKLIPNDYNFKTRSYPEFVDTITKDGLTKTIWVLE